MELIKFISITLVIILFIKIESVFSFALPGKFDVILDNVRIKFEIKINHF